jgi:predicted nucleic acid-binding protein
LAKVRKIYRRPDVSKNHYVVDANFLANRFIPISIVPDATQLARIERCNEWWDEIDGQLAAGRARVYIPDICIAETFKVLAQKYYVEGWFKTPVDLSNARNRLRRTITTPTAVLKSAKRRIKYHDISTTRDIIISVDRFYELFHKSKLKVSLPDLIVVATAKYLVDFYDIPTPFLHIVTLDRQLRAGSHKIQELPNAYDPTDPADRRDRIFADHKPKPAA